MLGRLMPREGKFFELFNAHAARIVEGSRELAAMIGTFSELDAHALPDQREFAELVAQPIGLGGIAPIKGRQRVEAGVLGGIHRSIRQSSLADRRARTLYCERRTNVFAAHSPCSS